MKLLAQFCLVVSLTCTSFAIHATADLIPEKLVLMSTDNFGIVYTHELKENQTIYGLSKFFNTNMNLISAANPGVELSNVRKFQSVNIPINTDMLISERKLSPQKHYIPVFYTVKAKDNLFRISKVYFNQKIENVMDINNLTNMELSIGQKLLVGWYEYDPVYKNKLAWNDKGIEVDFNGSTAQLTTIETNPSKTTVVRKETYTPVEKRREVAQKKNEKKKMQFNKIVSVRETPLQEEPTVQQTVPVKKVETPVIPENMEEVITEEVITPSNENPTVEVVEDITEDVLEDVDEEEKVLSTNPFEARNEIYQGEYDGKPAIHSKKIRAQWNSKSKDKTNLFALHATAKKGSFIEVYNPMLDRMVIAKVVGNIPDKIYKNNVELIVSPKVAETLGVVDKKFFVTIRFIED